ncbi:LysR family transcriptional regulator [Clostridium omnivorum]|uniref:LysR family transcriptional regulator n=1 Tax=Clostridium omnivorum TaxID=1604902 RepID=A0ABQ5N987_9CLOT|nr:LysR family transcriptional regulator [Clostridium sp. E14]GLC31657.1 LysR family transcriptional regulator [Clostridium sp. E14]
MQIKFIESFLQLYEELNISKTSAQLFITQQGLSRQIKSLEKELDVVLFERSKSGVTPTEICNGIYPILKNMQGEYKKAAGVIEKYKQKNRQSIYIAFAYGLSNGVNTDFIFEYQKNNLDVDIHIQEWSKQICLQKLLKDEIDIAFLVNPFQQELFNCLPLAEDYMYAAFHKDHPLAITEGSMDFSLLDGEKIITGSPENALREMFDYFCKLTNINPHIIVSSSYSLNFVNAMRENAGIVTVTSAMAFKINNPNIVIRRLVTPEPGYMYCCTSRHIKPNKDIASLLKYIKEHFKLVPIKKFSD